MACRLPALLATEKVQVWKGAVSVSSLYAWGPRRKSEALFLFVKIQVSATSTDAFFLFGVWAIGQHVSQATR